MTTTNTKKELTLNQESMIKVSYMLADKDFKDLFDYQFLFIVNNSKVSVYMKDYIKTIYDRINRESKMVMESISNEEIYNSTLAMWKTYETITKITDDLVKKVKVDDNTYEEFQQQTSKFDKLVEEINDQMEEVVEFYKGL